VVSGKVKTFKVNEEGKEYIASLYTVGDFFGYIELMQESPFQSSTMTVEETQIGIVPKRDFYSLIYNNHQIVQKFIKLLSGSVLDKEEQLLKMVYNSVRKRVAKALLLLYERYHNNADSDTFSMALGREDLANIVGTAKETLIRTLADFKEEGLVSMQGSQITVLNKDKLLLVKN
jgi:CRP-like cAMP-binding protein